MINEDEDGMIFTRNSLNPSKFDYQHGKKKSELLEDSNSLFGDSDTSEENFSYTTNRLHHMKEDLGELNNLETTLDFISHRLTQDTIDGKRAHFTDEKLRTLSSRLKKLESQMQSKVNQMEKDIKTSEKSQEVKPQYSKENMRERLRKEQEEDLLGLSETKKQQMKLLENQKVTKKRKRKKKSKKEKSRKSKQNKGDKNENITKIQDQMRNFDDENNKSKVEIDL